MGSGLPQDDPLACWKRERLRRQFLAWRARCDPKCVRTLCHLDPATVFNMAETERPTSVDLAIDLGLSLSERRVLRRSTELPRPAPATLGYRSTVAGKGRSTLRSAARNARRGKRLRRATGSVQPPVQPQKHEMSKDEWIVFLSILCLFVLVGIFTTIALTTQ